MDESRKEKTKNQMKILGATKGAKKIHSLHTTNFRTSMYIRFGKQEVFLVYAQAAQRGCGPGGLTKFYVGFHAGCSPARHPPPPHLTRIKPLLPLILLSWAWSASGEEKTSIT